MTYRTAIKVYWGKDERGTTHTAAQIHFAKKVIERKCRMYGEAAKRHTLWCCAGTCHDVKEAKT